MSDNIKTVESMTKKDFNDVPQRKRGENIGVFNSLIILPGTKKDMHDSGFRSMDFVAVRGDKPICKLSGCSDVLRLNGTGGRGNGNWSLDCLPQSGLLHIWSNRFDLVCGPAISSFSIYTVPKERK